MLVNMNQNKKKCKDCNPCEDQTVKVHNTLPDCAPTGGNSGSEEPFGPCPMVLPAYCIAFAVPPSEEGGDSETTIINLAQILSELTYTNETPMPAQVGGYPAGTTFLNQTIQQMLDGLLYPYQFPAFTAFSRTNLESTYEVGQSVSIGNQTFTWTISNLSNFLADTVSIQQLFTPITTLYGPDENTGSEAVNLTATISSPVPATLSLYTISAQNTLGQTFTNTIQRNWRFRMFHGTSASTTLNEAGILALTSSNLVANFNGSKAFAAGDYKYIAYPTAFGTATTFTDSVTNLNVPMEPPYVVAVTNSFGITANYRVHRSTNPLGGSITIIVA